MIIKKSLILGEFLKNVIPTSEHGSVPVDAMFGIYLNSQI